MLAFAVAANRRDRPIEKREEERTSFILSPFERGMQSPQLSQLPLSPKWCQALYSGHCTLYTICRLNSDHTGHQQQVTQLWTLHPTFKGQEYKGSAFFFPLFYGPVPSIHSDAKGEHTLLFPRSQSSYNSCCQLKVGLHNLLAPSFPKPPSSFQQIH